jgi:CheY-like chemotaxis protein/anti-sigma regulatory factor (Ser/Thr protein kinase)
MEPMPQNLSELASEMVRFPYVSIPEGVSIQQTLQSDLPAAEIDSPLVRRLLVELLQNALEAVEDGGVIQVSTGVTQAEEAQSVFVEIEDNGPGMDEETKEKMFDPFFSTKSPDRGLGLASVLGVVRIHKGELRVESRPKQGTKIRVLFPAIESQVNDSEAPDTSREDWRGTGTVLVVDEEPSIRSIAKSILEAAGFAVLLAEDEPTGIRIFRENSDDIRAVLFSATVSFSLGEKAFVEMHRVNPEAAIVISSEYAGEEPAARLSEPHVSGFLRVPFGPKELIGKLQEVMIGRGKAEGK